MDSIIFYRPPLAAALTVNKKPVRVSTTYPMPTIPIAPVMPVMPVIPSAILGDADPADLQCYDLEAATKERHKGERHKRECTGMANLSREAHLLLEQQPCGYELIGAQGITSTSHDQHVHMSATCDQSGGNPRKWSCEQPILTDSRRFYHSMGLMSVMKRAACRLCAIHCLRRGYPGTLATNLQGATSRVLWPL